MKVFTHRLVAVAFSLAALSFSMSRAAAQNSDTQVIRGTLNDSTDSKTYPIDLAAGDALLVTADATSGNLDTVLYLYEPNSDRIAANNDDRAEETLDSAIGYIAVKAGTYILEITRYDSSSRGDFRMEITVGDPGILSALDSITRIQLSGVHQTRDTEHFRIHYTLEGSDRVTQDYVNAVAIAVEEVYEIQINQLGWYPPPPDGVMGGNDLYDVYLGDLIDGDGEGALGYNNPESIIGDNPNSPEIEERASTSYMQVENDFRSVDGDTPIQLMRTTFAHEYHHAIQFGFDSDDPHNWVYEATASWMETITLPDDEDATGYVAYAYQYPELCFGTTNDPGAGQLQYGQWTFLQHLADEYGEHAVLDFWRNLALFDGFAALQATINDYGGGLLRDVIAAYRVKDLARNYVFAPDFDATVWMEDRINDVGRWTYTGEGIQELGANYFHFDVDDDVYYAGLVNDDGTLQLFGLGVANGEVTEIQLGRGGIVRPGDYDYFYLMVFNPNYDEEVDDCTYYDYQIDITTSKEAPNPVMRTWDARYFEPLS